MEPREGALVVSSIALVRRPRRALTAFMVVAALAAATVAALPSTSAARSHDRPTSARALALHDAMRALWESHGAWTERAIVDFVGGLPDTPFAVDRLLRNQA